MAPVLCAGALLRRTRFRGSLQQLRIARLPRSSIQWRTLSEAATQPGKPYYITSPIFYVNAAPHIGHLYTLILTDVLKRWQVLKGNQATLCTGTDEHGMKIQRAAAKAQMTPQAFCDQNYQSFVSLAEAAKVDYDHFIRTSEPEHHFAVQHFWLMLRERGHIYASKHEGWYSVSDETFYPETTVHRTLDPATGRTFMASVETGSEVEWTSEHNYHFRLASFRDRLLEFYERNPKFVVPDTRMREVVKAVEDGLNDLSVSRPVERLQWGIPVPDDRSQTIYVWLDALINYITKTNYPFHIPGQEHAAGWPADVHVIGKDIIRFHCIYWPAFLMALDIEPPRQVLAHGHWTLGHRKMSKSVGNVVNPFYALDRFGHDGLRYYMIRDGGIRNDAAYDNAYVVKRYVTELQAAFGNLLRRVNRSPFWDVRRSIKHAVALKWQSANPRSKEHVELLSEVSAQVSLKFEALDPSGALETIQNAISLTNKYITDMAPWQKGTSDSSVFEDKSFAIALCAESLRICGILLQPVIPDSASKLLDQLNIAPDQRSLRHANFGSNSSFGFPAQSKETEALLFEKLRCTM